MCTKTCFKSLTLLHEVGEDTRDLYNRSDLVFPLTSYKVFLIMVVTF